MTAFRFVHTADLHLDSPFRGLTEVPPDLHDTLRDATFQAFRRIVDLCIERKADCLIIAGDLHDAADRSLRSLIRLREQFTRLAERNIAVFICHGNHDPLSEWEARFTWPDNVHVFGTDRIEARPLVKKGAEVARVYGISYGAEQVTDNLATQFKREGDAPWAIGVLHTNVGNDRNHLNYAPCEVKDLVKTGMDYWALGHIHAHRVLREGSPLIVYPGNPQGRHPRETGPRGCYVVEIDERGTSTYQFVDADVVRWHHSSIGIDGLARLEDLLAGLEERMEAIRRDANGRGNIVRWALTGRGPLHRELSRPGRLEDLLATLRERCGGEPDFIWPESIQDGTARDIDLDALRREENLLGDFLKLSEHDDEHLIDELQKSLNALFEDPRIRRHLSPPDEARLRDWIRSAERQGVDRLLTDDD